MKRKGLSPKDAFFQLLHLNDNQLTRLLDFGEKCGGIEISTRKVEGDWPQEVPLLPVGDTWEAVDTVKVWLKDSTAYAVIKWLDSGEVETRIHNVDLDKATSESRRLKAAVDSVLAIVRRGRPYRTGAFENAEAFMAVFGPAVLELRRKGENPTTGNVLRALRTKLGEVDRAQLTRWYQSLGWQRWGDFLRDVN